MKKFWELMDEYIESYWENKPISVDDLLSQCATESDREELAEQIQEWTAAQEGYENLKKKGPSSKGDWSIARDIPFPELAKNLMDDSSSDS